MCSVNSVVSFPECVDHLYDRRPSSLQIEFFHSGLSIFTRYLPPNIPPVVSPWMWFAFGSTMIAYFGVLYLHSGLNLCEVSICFVRSIGNTIDAFLNVVVW